MLHHEDTFTHLLTGMGIILVRNIHWEINTFTWDSETSGVFHEGGADLLKTRTAVFSVSQRKKMRGGRKAQRR